MSHNLSKPDAETKLQARLENLSRNVLCGGLPAAGKAGAAVAYGNPLELATFLTDARRVLPGKDVVR